MAPRPVASARTPNEAYVPHPSRTPQSESGGACEPFVAERLLSPPSDRWAAVLMRKLLLQMPYPIVDGFVMRSNRGIHCMGE